MTYKLTRGEAEIPRMAALGAENYGDENCIADTAFLTWQLLENPAGAAQTALALSDADEVIGECTQLPYTLRAFGRQIDATCVVNTLIRKKDRGLAVFYALHKLSFDACAQNALAYAVPNPHSYPLFGKLFQFVTVTHIPLLILPMQPKALVQKRVGAPPACLVPGLTLGGARPRTPRGLTVSALDADNMQSFFDAFWPAVQDKYPIMGQRTAAYMQWRYCAHPLREYTVFAAWEKGTPLGYAVACVMDVEGVKSGMIADLLTRPGRRDAGIALASHCLAAFRKESAELAGALMLAHCEEYRFLRSAGFIPCPARFLPQPFPLIVKPFSADAAPFAKADNWFFTMGDYDAI